MAIEQWDEAEFEVRDLVYRKDNTVEALLFGIMLPLTVVAIFQSGMKWMWLIVAAWAICSVASLLLDKRSMRAHQARIHKDGPPLVHCVRLLTTVLGDREFIRRNIEKGGIAARLCQTAIKRIEHESDGVRVEHHDEQEVLMLIEQWITSKKEQEALPRIVEALRAFFRVLSNPKREAETK